MKLARSEEAGRGQRLVRPGVRAVVVEEVTGGPEAVRGRRKFAGASEEAGLEDRRKLAEGRRKLWKDSMELPEVRGNWLQARAQVKEVRAGGQRSMTTEEVVGGQRMSEGPGGSGRGREAGWGLKKLAEGRGSCLKMKLLEVEKVVGVSEEVGESQRKRTEAEEVVGGSRKSGEALRMGEGAGKWTGRRSHARQKSGAARVA
ncbi:hypothetical protein FNV43_RR21397 [Rhamnella rubrinervis]|uniref:Uncharacterized protein n=1 Tax=Rhamnella rubrinervis TaxID=2594499 RepID=A0A8K0E320_9ROSA|nr:hypothetical protein FNV43_RR21397 [Rhamnella rubrinervis]